MTSDVFGHFWPTYPNQSLNRIMSLNRMILCSKLKNGLWKIVTKSQVVTKFDVTKSRLHCTYLSYIERYSVSTLGKVIY